MTTEQLGNPHQRVTLWQRLTGVDDLTPEGWVRPREPLRHLAFDVGIAVLLIAGMVISALTMSTTYAAMNASYVPPPLWTVIVLPIVFGLGLVFRHATPITSMVLGATAFTLGQVYGYGEALFTQVVCFFLIYSAGAWSAHRTLVTVLRIAVLVAGTVWAVAGYAYQFQSFPALDPTADLTSLILLYTSFTALINVLYFGAALLFGSNDYRRAGRDELLRRQHEALAEQREALVAERRTVAHQAVQLDRVAIARELHDVVAHYVSLMGLQAGAARRNLSKSPEKAEAALLEVESSARTAITELQSMLSTLRDDDDRSTRSSEATDAPSTRTIDRIPELVEQLRGIGMQVDYDVIGPPTSVSPVVGTTAYRIVQEALTNARKHAGPGSLIDVRLRFLSTSFEVEVTDTGSAPGGSTTDRSGGGRGLTGMRERALAVGGTVEAGPRPEGGFRVRARLPLAGAVAEAAEFGRGVEADVDAEGGSDVETDAGADAGAEATRPVD